MFPLQRPAYYALRNLLRRDIRRPSLLTRDLVILLLIVVVMIGVYFGGLWTLRVIHAAFGFIYVPPSQLFGSFMFVVFFFLFVSNVIEGLGSLFSSRSLDTIVASPISELRFLIGKSIEILMSSSWMLIIFVIPIVMSFGSFYHAGWEYYVTAIVTIIPFVVIAATSALLVVLLFASAVPANRTREVLGLSGIALALGGVLLLGLIDPGHARLLGADDVTRLFQLISRPQTNWLPSYWVGSSISEFLAPTGRRVDLSIALLFCVSIALSTLAYIVFRLTYFRASSRAQSQRQGVRLDSRQSQRRWRRLVQQDSVQRAIAAKEYKVFFRDLSQASQTLMLLGICGFYVFGIRLIYTLDVTLPGWERQSWRQLLVLISAATEAFIVSAVCTRFVYPSVSLEGESIWTLESSPVSLSKILSAKFLAWLLPVTVMCVAVFCLGGASIGFGWQQLVLKAISTVVVCYGMVGLAIGLGAVFANFQWEHSAQLAAGFGNLVFMLTGVCLVSFSLLLLWLPLVGQNMTYFQQRPMLWSVLFVSSYGLLLLLNVFVNRIALSRGKRALEARFETAQG